MHPYGLFSYQLTKWLNVVNSLICMHFPFISVYFRFEIARSFIKLYCQNIEYLLEPNN